MTQNIFQIWESIGRRTPFAVRRDNWNEKFYTIVEKVDCEKMPYGKAYGYSTIDGKYSSHYEYDSKWRREKIIPCCGCYQWTLVENADTTTYKDGLKATERTVKDAYTINSELFFGKYKGMTVKEIFRENPKYIEWAINNIDLFLLTPEAFTYLNKFKPDFKFQDITIKVNNKKIIKQQEIN